MISTMHTASDSRLRRVAEALAGRGWDVWRITPKEATASEADGIRDMYIQPVRRHLRSGAGPVAILLTLLSRLRATVQIVRCGARVRADVYHAHEPDSWLAGLVLKWLTGARLVCDIHEIYDERSEVFGRVFGPPINSMVRTVLVLLSRQTDLELHVSQARADHHQFLRSRRALVLPNYPKASEWSRFGRREVFMTGGRMHIVQGGPLRVQYAGVEILRAIERMRAEGRNVCVVFAGGHRLPPGHEAVRLLDDLLREGFVKLTPRLSQNEMVELYATCDVGLALTLPVNANYRMAVPRKMYEYAAAGLPSLVGPAPDCKSFAERWGCALTIEECVEEKIHAGLVQLAEPGLLSAMSRRAETASTHLDWDEAADTLGEEYKILDESRMK